MTFRATRLDDVLGLETQVAAAWPRAEPARLGLAEFRDRFPGQKLTPAILARAIALGLISLDDASVVVRDPGFLRVGSELARHGVPAAEALDELQALQEAAASRGRRTPEIPA